MARVGQRHGSFEARTAVFGAFFEDFGDFGRFEGFVDQPVGEPDDSQLGRLGERDRERDRDERAEGEFFFFPNVYSFPNRPGPGLGLAGGEGFGEAGGAVFAWFTLFTLDSLGALRACFAFGPLSAGVTFCSSRTGETCRARGPGRPRIALRTLGTPRPLLGLGARCRLATA